MDINNAQLRQFLTDYFDSDELDDLCFDYFPRVQKQFTRGMSKNDEIRLLLKHCRDQGERSRLIGALQELRPGPFQQEFELARPEPTPTHVVPIPTVRNPRQIFISHAYEDARLAHRLADDLQQHGWQVWIAPDSIQPGEKWVAAINRGLVESGVFVLLISEHTMQSRWVKSETDIAIQWEHEGKMRFIPLQASSRPVADIPALWQAYQYIPLASDFHSGLAALLAKLEERAYKPPPAKLPLGQRLWAGVRRVPPMAWGSVVVILVAFLFISWLSQLAGGGIEPTTIPLATSATEVATVDTATNTTDPNNPPVNASLHDTWTRPTDGMTMVFVPGGTFMMGSNPDDDPNAQSDEQPQHEVRLDAFWTDQTEVTNDQFGRFVTATGYETTAEVEGYGYIYTGTAWDLVTGADWQHPTGPENNLDGLGNHPVVLVSWDDAVAYCDWVGGQLPTEAQWEYVARGSESSIFPWGDEFDGAQLNYCDTNCEFDWKDETVDDDYGRTAPVVSYDGQSWAGAYDIAGNVWEWVADWYDGDYYEDSPAVNPKGPDTGSTKVVRGGSWVNYPSDVRGAPRLPNTPGIRYDYVGFRCTVSPGN